MDDLFKRAAENYPLKEQESDWNAIGSRLDKSAITPVTTNHKRQLIFIALMAALLLHLPFKLFETYYKHIESTGKMPVVKKINADEKVEPHTSDNDEDMALTNSIIPQVSYENAFNRARVLIEEAHHKTVNLNTENREVRKSNQVVDSSEKEITAIQSTLEINEKFGLENNQEKKINIDNSSATTTSTESIAVEENVQYTSQTPALSKAPEQSIKKPLSGWYAGINTGLSFSIVKGQQLSEPGYTAGLGLGYKFSPKWSLETGLKFSEKKYYSNGEYFIPKNADPNMPPDMKVVSVKSKTLLLEIPLKAKYNFNKTLKGQFFLTGGLNTFIVGKEVNDYIIYRNGSNGTMHATYNENQSYLAAVADVSVGYEKFLKNKQTLRIEPWIQIARKGIGVGQLPVSGFGVQAGYFFHK